MFYRKSFFRRVESKVVSGDSKMKKLFLLSFLIPMLSGCLDSGGKLGKEGSPIWWNRVSSAEVAAHFGEECAIFGFKYNTPEMSNCIMVSAQASKNKASRTEDAFISNMQQAGSYGTNSSGISSAPTLTKFLKSSYNSGVDTMCLYDDGSVDNIGVGICPLTK